MVVTSEFAVHMLVHHYLCKGVPTDENPTLVSPRVCKSYFFLPVESMVDVWNGVHQINPHLKVDHLLWALFYYKVYNTWDHSTQFFCVCRKTYQLHVMAMTEVLNTYYTMEVRTYSSLLFF